MESVNSYEGKRISVIGAGVSGTELALLAKRLGADVFISDTSEISEEKLNRFREAGIKWEMHGNTDQILNADLIVVGSGISPQTPVLRKAEEHGISVMGELDFVAPYLDGKIIAITGSNGKTTTTSMTGYFLEKLGYHCLTGGNIGNALAKAAGEHYDFIVVELSSFQLHWTKRFRAEVGVVTNLAPDHIDWHGSYEKYVEAKANLFRCLNQGGVPIYQKSDQDALAVSGGFPLQWEKAGPADGIYMDEANSCAWLVRGGEKKKLFDFADVKLLGKHNLENTAMACAALAHFGISVPGGLIGGYTAPGHRCAYVGEVKGVVFVDDSKGTNVAASVTAMRSLPNEKVVVLGGKGKGEDYGPLAEAVVQYAAFAVLLGAEKEKIAEALRAAGYEKYVLAGTMEEAVEAAFEKAAAGQTVLLSPACTSWDMYSDYGKRGEHFSEIAKGIIEREG